MSLRYRRLEAGAHASSEAVVSPRTCDCCPTDAAIAGDGVVAVYRGRTEDEIRDIMVTRLVDGVWSAETVVHSDGWRIEACPVNGPAVSAEGQTVAVAWFTGAQDEARVQIAWSDDGGATFGEPTRIDQGNPGGRVDVVLGRDGGAWVSWLESVGTGQSDLRIRYVREDGTAGEPVTVGAASAGRATGMPQMVEIGGRLVLAWTDTSKPETRVVLTTAEMR